MSAKAKCDGVNAQTPKDEGEELYAPWVEGLTPPAKKAFLQAVEKDPWFDHIFQGGKLSSDHHLILRCQVAFATEPSGIVYLVYNGKRYNRRVWSWRPPKVIRQLGRQAREQPNPYNTHAEVHALALTPDGYRPAILDRCPSCGGELVYNSALELYCKDCGLMEEVSYRLPAGYDSIGQSAPMSDHNYSDIISKK